MSFDFSTLVTDRMQSDVDQRNARGTYNAADLNRVTAAMEALDELFQAYGYHSGYTPIFVASRGGQGGLPEGYTRLQYIESSGTQWIDTGFKPNQLSRVVMDVNILAQSGWPRAVFGGRNGTTTAVDSFVFWAFAEDYFRSDLDTDLLEIDIPPAGRHHIDKDRNTTTVDNFSQTQTNHTFQSNYNLALFSQNDADGIDARMVAMQLYGCQVYDDGVLVRDFLPCESPDGAVGLYDAANGMFYGNAGTGAFTAGPELSGNGIPAGYTEAEYLSASGGAAVDLAFRPNQDTEMEIKFSTAESGDSHAVCAADTDWQDTEFSLWYNAIGFGNATTYNYTMADGQPHVFRLSKAGAYMDEALLWDIPDQSDFSVGYNLTAFALNRAGTLREYLTGSIYYIKLYQGGELVREFVPFTDASGAAGFYDRVGHGFYTSAGLTAGPAVPPESEPDPGPVLDPYTWYESDIPMQSQMAQYLANLAALRGVLSQVAAEPPTPESMALLTYVEANDIEQILLDIEAVLTTIGESFLRAGMPWAVAGGPEIFARNGGTA